MSRNNVNAMAERYKAEMMRIYNQSADKSASSKKQPPSQHEKIKAPEQPANKNLTGSVREREIIEDSPKPKFPSPDEILAAEQNNAVAVIASVNEGKGNYGSAQGEPLQDENPLEPLYSNTGRDQPFEEMKGKGYIKAEITTANGAIPVENASVLITRRENGRTLLVKMLLTDSSGTTETAELPAPDIVYSETPEPDGKPFAEYILSVFADGFYAVPEIILPVFTTVKSIQPISLVPLAKFDAPDSQPSDRNTQ
ncbi:MAG: hypothetical protein IJ007_05965 [Oscillospiraceae bacterium]|nr:hypothetical protein [Oscillospiraceae bacterium]